MPLYRIKSNSHLARAGCTKPTSHHALPVITFRAMNNALLKAIMSAASQVVVYFDLLINYYVPGEDVFLQCFIFVIVALVVI